MSVETTDLRPPAGLRRVAPPDRPVPGLRVVYAEHLGGAADPLGTWRWVFPDRPVEIGRDPRGPDRLALPFARWASRRHARATYVDPQTVRLEDLGARNPLVVDGAPVAGPVEVGVGAVVRIGGTLLVVDSAPPKARERALREHPPPPSFSAWSWSALAAWGAVARAAGHDHGLLLLGEMGTGKTRLARQVHALGPRRRQPFVAHNCSAIPLNLEEATLFGVVAGFLPGVKANEGLLTRAGSGTLFLDEVADLPTLAQAKLLDAFDPSAPSYSPVGGRPLPTRCRLISATNRDPFELARRGVIRQDLLSRLVTTTLTMPPLRQRRSDILAIFTQALSRHGVDLGERPAVPDVETAEALIGARWTENARGVESLAARVASGEVLSIADMQAHADRGQSMALDRTTPASAAAPPTLAGPPRPSWPPASDALLTALAERGWQVKQTAAWFGVRRETLSRLIKARFGGREGARAAWARRQEPGGAG